jgi:hypothetical protein
MKVTLLIALLFFTSCSSSKKEAEVKSSYTGVSVEKDYNKKIPLIESKKTSKSYGPEVAYKEKFGNKGAKEVVSLYFYPSIFNTLSYLKVVDNLQKYKKAPSVYSGAGMGAVIAAFLAMGLTPDHIEWKFFALLESLENERFQSKKWKTIVFKFLKKEFKNKRIEQLEKVLILPVYDKKLGKIRYLSRGNLYNILVINIDLKSNTKTTFLSPLLLGNLKVEELFSKGIDKIAVLNSLGKSLEFKNGNHFYIGVYSKLIGMSLKTDEMENKNLSWFNFQLGKRNLDFVSDLQELIMSSLNSNQDLVLKLNEFVEKEKN